MKYSTDITIEWLGEKSKRDNKILKYKLYDEFKYKGKVYKIDGHKIVTDLKKDEIEFAEILSLIPLKILSQQIQK